MSYRQQVKNRIGRTSHCYIQCHSVQECLPGGNATGKYTLVSFFIVFHSVFYNQFGCIFEKLCSVFVSSYNSSVARQRQTDCFIETVHRVSSKHAGTTSASRTSILFDIRYFLIAYAFIGRFNHRINQIEVLTVPFASFHWPA